MNFIINIAHRFKLFLLKQSKLRDFGRFEDTLYNAYYSLEHKTGSSQTLIVMIDEHTPKGGLVDKLKGIISGYLLAEVLHYQFFVYIKVDNFPLYDFIKSYFPVYLHSETNNVLSFNAKQSRPFVLYNHLPISFNWTLRRLRKIQQIHLYCNLNLTSLIKKCSKSDAARHWGQTFQTLFYFDDRIFNAFPSIPRQVKKVGIHLRFMSLLGDFQDSGVDPHLFPDKQVLLIDTCKRKFLELMKMEDNDAFFFLFTDSVKFIDAVLGDADIKAMNKIIYTDKSNIAHTGLMGKAEALERAVKDFYYLSRCDKVYLIKEPGMHNSDFSRYASFIRGIDFISV